MNKFSFKNPFNQTFDGFNEQATAHTNEATANEAAKLFADKPYTVEHRQTYLITKGLKWLSAAISFVSAYCAVFYVLSLLMGIYIAFALSFGVCLLIEFLKSSVWATTAKNRLKYRVWAVGSLVVLLGLHLLSFGASVFGAYIAADYLPTEPQPTEPPILQDVTLASFDSQINSIDKQTNILLTEKPNEKTGKFSSTTKTLLSKLTTQKDSLQTVKKRLLEQITAKNEAEAKEAKESAAKAQQTRIEQISVYRWAAAIVAGLFELVFILCQCFIIRYLFRAYIDSKNDIKTTNLPVTQPIITSSVTQPVTPEVTEPQQRTPIGLKMPEIVSKAAGVGSIGSCANCNKDFVKNSYTHKFCAETCRIEAWERKNGKKLVRSTN